MRHIVAKKLVILAQVRQRPDSTKEKTGQAETGFNQRKDGSGRDRILIAEKIVLAKRNDYDYNHN